MKSTTKWKRGDRNDDTITVMDDTSVLIRKEMTTRRQRLTMMEYDNHDGQRDDEDIGSKQRGQHIDETNNNDARRCKGIGAGAHQGGSLQSVMVVNMDANNNDSKIMIMLMMKLIKLKNSRSCRTSSRCGWQHHANSSHIPSTSVVMTCHSTIIIIITLHHP